MALVALTACGLTERRLVEPSGDDTGERHVETYEVSEAPTPNPERGLVQYVDFSDPADVEFVAGLDVTLANVRVRLDRFRHVPISAQFIAELEDGFDRIRRAGLKLILRFQYNNGSGADPPVDRVMAHIDQLAPIIERHADVIAVMQAGFVGAWGEWHTSLSGLTAPRARVAILERLLAALPPSRSLQVRSPTFKVEAFPDGPIGEAIARSAAPSARIGHHNDCLLADPTDRGTYRRPIERVREYLAADARFVPVGGETCAPNPPRTDCESAVRELRRFHWSYLNRSYHPAVIAGWRRQGCMDAIKRDLGYRLVLRRASWPRAVSAGERVEISIDIENLGFAAPFNPRDVAIVIGETKRYEVPLPQVDPRGWLPGEVHRLTLRFELPGDLPGGDHPLALWLPDPAPMLRPWPAYSIRLANRGTWREDKGDNLLGLLRVR